MPGSFPGRPGGEPDEPLLDMIIGRRPLPPGAPPEMHDLARMLAAAAGPAEPGELDGQAAALTVFRQQAFRPGISPAALRPARRWLSGRPARGRLPIAAALVAAAAGLGSTAVAAYAGVLPGPIQHLAHVAAGAPDSHATPPQKHQVISPRRSDHHTNGAAPHKIHPATTAPAHGNPGHHARGHGKQFHMFGTINPACDSGSVPTQNAPEPGRTQGTPGPGGASCAAAAPSADPSAAAVAPSAAPQTTLLPPGL